MSFPVFDLHCDTASALLWSGRHSQASLLRNNLHIDLERGKKLGGYAQCFACFTSPLKEISGGTSAVSLFERQLEIIQDQVQKNSDILRFARCAQEIRQNLSEDVASAVLTIEGPAGFQFDPACLESLHQTGFLISTLGWNESNVLTGSHVTGEGLSDLGRAYVKEMQRLGMIVDVSHISDQGFWDIIAVTEGPVIASHSNSRHVCNVSRNITDDMFLSICQTGGVVGINQYAEFLGERPSLETVADHIVHFLELDPDGTHIALGGDLDGCDVLADGFDGIQDYPKLALVLQQRGLDSRMIHNIYWNNAIGVIERCCT